MNKLLFPLIKTILFLIFTVFLLFSTVLDTISSYFFDQDAPLILLSSLPDRIRGNKLVDLQVFDNSQPLEVNIYLNGLKFSPDSPLMIDTKQYPDGEYTLLIEATDHTYRKNHSRKTLSFLIDNTPPIIEIVLDKNQPQPGGVIAGWISLNEPVRISAFFNTKELILVKDNKPEAINQDKPFVSYYFIQGVELKERVEFIEIMVEATDEVGNQTTKKLSSKFLPLLFPKEHLTVSENITHLLDVRLLKAERIIVEEAMSTVSPVKLWQGDFLPPVDAVITSAFGFIRNFNQGLLIDQHKGIDYRAKTFTPIKSTNYGKVVFADNLPVRGNTIIIDHGLGVFSLYYHLSVILTKPGEDVSKGQIIGKSGNSGLSTAEHLHFEIRIQGVAVDPAHFYANSRKTRPD